MVNGRILLVEDEDDLARLFEYALTRRGHRVRRAKDAAAGLKSFRQWKPDLILLDVVLPGMSGHELLELIRRESAVCVLMISGQRSPASVAQGLKLGANGSLLKPFSLDELCGRVALELARAPVASRGALKKPVVASRRRARPRPAPAG